MTKYELIIYWGGRDNAFLVEVPELPGCKSDGETPQEALANAYDAIACWIEAAKELGREVPAPRKAYA